MSMKFTDLRFSLDNTNSYGDTGKQHKNLILAALSQAEIAAEEIEIIRGQMLAQSRTIARLECQMERATEKAQIREDHFAHYLNLNAAEKVLAEIMNTDSASQTTQGIIDAYWNEKTA